MMGVSKRVCYAVNLYKIRNPTPKILSIFLVITTHAACYSSEEEYSRPLLVAMFIIESDIFRVSMIPPCTLLEFFRSKLLNFDLNKNNFFHFEL